MSEMYLYLAAVFLGVFGAAMLVMTLLAPNPVRDRIQELGAAAPAREAPDAWIAHVAKISGPLAKLSVPEDGWEKSSLRTRFMNAGLRDTRAPVLYFAAKTFLAFVLPSVLWLVLLALGTTLSTTNMMLVLLVAAAFGFYLPNGVLSRLVALRQREIVEAFPDALDLMTVCVEAGLAVDSAIARIAGEMATTAPALSEEMNLVSLELRAGASKERALRNLAMRTGVDEVDGLVAMLIQAERFGTSIGASLRVHADALRTRRRQRAEEAAAKVALKLLFPLIFCIFPAIMLVLLGPAMLQIIRVLQPVAGH
ncbi:type II secretion system F family protein [Noviherbaspirillum denitrificans]|uniref:Type II secretion system protein n=1 Tax=Noviherbaspirillum denitrificans TaxID=1968433 RepID=A0A254T8X6_9BURK|nr:type II secretion system F family protein [Noviherbaspirillum denitrificans]OWW19096.1 type II secretion system protein [Noviherbaspirillum denitrificans]